jgi:hypothetical protein
MSKNNNRIKEKLIQFNDKAVMTVVVVERTVGGAGPCQLIWLNKSTF